MLMKSGNQTLNILMEGLKPTEVNIPSEIESLKTKLTESIRPAMLFEVDEEDKADNKEDKKKDKDDKDSKKKVKWYKDVQDALDKKQNPVAPTQVGAMKAIGIPDDDKGVNRGLFNKKLRRVKNDEGGVYEFNEDELARLRAVIGIG